MTAQLDELTAKLRSVEAEIEAELLRLRELAPGYDHGAADRVGGEALLGQAPRRAPTVGVAVTAAHRRLPGGQLPGSARLGWSLAFRFRPCRER